IVQERTVLLASHFREQPLRAAVRVPDREAMLCRRESPGRRRESELGFEVHRIGRIVGVRCQPALVAGSAPRDVEAHMRVEVTGSEEREVVHHGDVTQMELGGPALDAECVIGEASRPEETRRCNATVEVVNLRARTGLEEIDSYESESAFLAMPVGRAELAL